MLKLIPDYHPPNGITARVYSVYSEYATLAWAISVVAFEGIIPDGSAGKDHAEFVKLTSLEAMAR